MHKTYWKVHLNSEEVFLRDIAAVLSPVTNARYVMKKQWRQIFSYLVIQTKRYSEFNWRICCWYELIYMLQAEVTYFENNFKSFS